jgi:hypothetical protein
MNPFRNAGTLVFASGIVLAGGCTHSDTTPLPGTAVSEGVTNAQNAADRRVVERLVTARCAHEQSCNEIGNGKDYASHDVCMDQFRGKIANALNAYNCPRGIDESGVDQCRQAIEAEPCGLSLDQLLRQNACRSSAMCMK